MTVKAIVFLHIKINYVINHRHRLEESPMPSHMVERLINPRDMDT